MPELWMPGAVRRPQPGGVPLDASLPPRCTWHATADRINAAGYQPSFRNVADYLANVGYWPTLMWDPVTGQLEQAYPANVGGRALSRWNEDGAVHIQVEVYFAAGALRDVDGVPTRFQTIAETPCSRLEEILAWTDSWDVPRRWPIGAPNGRRQDNEDIWNAQAGHYAHAQVPGENHVDPGPMPSLTRVSAAPAAPKVEYLIDGIRLKKEG